jgi:hypothetical protein
VRTLAKIWLWLMATAIFTGLVILPILSPYFLIVYGIITVMLITLISLAALDLIDW